MRKGRRGDGDNEYDGRGAWVCAAVAAELLAIPAMLRNGFGFSLAAECVLTVTLYAPMVWAGPSFELRV